MIKLKSPGEIRADRVDLTPRVKESECGDAIDVDFGD
jgi:hypothetical protein